MTKKETSQVNKKSIFQKILTEEVSIILLLLGVFILIVSLVLYVFNDFFTDFGIVEPEHIAQYGDFIGGVVGSIWALAGVIK